MKRSWTAAWEKVNEEARCRKCGATGVRLDPAHIVPRGLGGGMEAVEIVPLCRPCHDRYDGRGEPLDLLPVLTRDEQVQAVKTLGLSKAYRRLTGDRS